MNDADADSEKCDARLTSKEEQIIDHCPSPHQYHIVKASHG